MSDQFDMAALLAQAQAVQQQLAEAQAAAAEQVVEGESGGGVVKVRVTGGLRVESVTIDPQVIDPADMTMLEDLVLTATNAALTNAKELTQSLLGGLDLGGAGGLTLGQ